MGSRRPSKRHGSVEQVYATGLTPGVSVSLYDGGGQVVETKSADDLGGVLFRNVTPGDGYRVGLAGGDDVGTASGPHDRIRSAQRLDIRTSRSRKAAMGT